MWDKLSRDRYMSTELEEQYPQYRFAKHKGYGTKLHYQLLDQYGPARLLRVEELAPGIFRGMLAGGAQALAVIREDGQIAVREAEPWA